LKIEEGNKYRIILHEKNQILKLIDTLSYIEEHTIQNLLKLEECGLIGQLLEHAPFFPSW
jgi:hypothetical protein